MEKKKNKVGAPPKLNRELILRITDYLRRGAYVETAVASAGVHKSAYYKWVKKGVGQKIGIHRELVDAIDKAMADAEMRDLTIVDKSATGTPAEYLKDENGKLVINSSGDPVLVKPYLKSDWKASAWRLERRNPKKWGIRQTLEHTGSEENPVHLEAKVSVKEMTDEELDRQMEEIKQKYFKNESKT